MGELGPQDHNEGEDEGDRLESWKEIAAFLRRDVRTVQRWERFNGLPIRRHPRAYRGVPYAYKHELNAWWLDGSAQTREETVRQPSVTRLQKRRFDRRLLIAGFALLTVAGATYSVKRARTGTPGVESPPDLLVTTHSREALRLYVEADGLIRRDSNRAAEALLREAIAQDARFASAHVLLAWALHNDGRSPADYQWIAEEADEMGATATEAERLFIHGSSLWLHDKHEDGCAAFEALHRVAPQHYWASKNLAFCYQEKADHLRISGAIDPLATAEYISATADLRPDDVARNVYAAWANEFIANNPSQATRYRQRAETLQRAGKYSNDGFPDAWLRFRSIYRQWLNDDIDMSYKNAIELVAKQARVLDARPLDDLYYFTGALLLTLGRTHEAENTFNLLSESAGANAVVAYARGDLPRARQLFTDYVGLPYDGAGTLFGILFAHLGMTDRARAVLKSERVGPGSPNAAAIEGELAFRAGEVQHAIERLRFAIHTTEIYNQYFLAAETLAEALVRAQQPEAALKVLDTATAERYRAYDPVNVGPLSGYFWLRVRVLQAELYQNRHRQVEADQIARQVVHLLSRADPDFPLLARATRVLRGQSGRSTFD